ncbi:unnamed protein product [Clonostachys rosea]|uniref:BTB domain-containing protein n=1 Tax=Bionectria ochroleuca TaxID=29856 RepID=A0ABY6TUX7_BIOOC|nr:unnamed protein product [Clonostachys rosea]
MPPKGRRGPSGPWGRLKPVVQDPLESMGLPSKGDNRLLDFSAQEKYYTKIMERYMGFCSDAGKPDELLRRFSALEIGESARPSTSSASTAASSTAPPSPSLSLLQSPANTKGLSDVMMALRKLREGIVASKRVDDFAVQAYLFCVRLSVLVKHPESYHPAILYLLSTLHPQQPLTSVELREVVAYLVLDAACRRGQMSEAYSIRREYRLQDAKVDAVLDALAHDNYVRFRKLKQSVDGHRARIMDWAEREMRMQTLKALGRAYLSIDLGFLESVTGSKWDDLKNNDGVGWELDGNKVVIKKVRARSDEQTVEIIVKGENLIAHRKVLIEHCEYFARCLKEPWVEGHNGTITFDDIEPRYLALFIGVAYSHSSIVPLAPPVSSPNPQAKRARTPLQDFVEVYKLCDRFVSPKMADYIVKCIHTSIGDGHRALYRCPSDEGQQKELMREFADGFEALEIMHPVQKEIGKKMIYYFCEGVSYSVWDKTMEEVVSDRPRFISDVSRGFASKLGVMEATKRAMKRKELSGP